MSTAAISSSASKLLSPAAAPAKAQKNTIPANSANGATPASAPPASQAASAAGAPVNGAVAALQEATETSAQTAKEAAGGDLQAQKLIAKAAAASPARNGSATSVSAKGAHISVKA